MTTSKLPVFIVYAFIILTLVAANAPVRRIGKRIHIPSLGLGPRCTGCPPQFCDDDPAIIHGYCCGCARFYDVLPVQCGAFLECPLNNYDLCHDYEYMMHCCCS